MKSSTKKRTVLLFFLLTFVCCSFSLSASTWKSVVDMKGLWKFSVGDDKTWASPGYDDSDWDQIYVPKKWENYYPEYNGYAWYRKTFDMRKWSPDNSNIALLLGRIDDVDEVYINGVKIGQTGSFLPYFESAYDTYRQYSIPDGILKKENNVIAIRVYDENGEGGIVAGDKIGIFYDDDISLLALNLSGTWKFSTNRQSGITNPDFNDSKWNTIRVPDIWENNDDYKDYDGDGWYRKTFTLPRNLTDEKLYLILGKIDDHDKVYLNGKQIGRTEYLNNYQSNNDDDAWLLYRVYRIPKGLLRSKNTLVVQVSDYHGNGGIYEGPVGLATYRDAKIIEDRSDGTRWGGFLNGVRDFFDNLNIDID